MKIIIALSVIFLLVFSALYDEFFFSNNEIPIEKVSLVVKDIKIDLPNFEFYDLHGNKKQITYYKGNPILLNFWASWCAPCLQEFPHIMELIRDNKELIFIAVSNDQHIKDIHKFINKFKKEYSEILSSRQVLFAWDPRREISGKKFNVIKLPETFIINRELKIVRKIVGANDWKTNKLNNFIKKL